MHRGNCVMEEHLLTQHALFLVRELFTTLKCLLKADFSEGLKADFSEGLKAEMRILLQEMKNALH